MSNITQKQTWRNQFGEHYQVPEAELFAAGLLDISWGNDMCPSFRWPEDTESKLTLWSDHPELDRREMRGARYVVYYTPHGAGTITPNDLSLETDDLAAAIKKMHDLRHLVTPAPDKEAA